MKPTFIMALAALWLVASTTGCSDDKTKGASSGDTASDSNTSGGDGDADGDTDSDSDTDADGDSDTDADGDSDTNANGDTDTSGTLDSETETSTEWGVGPCRVTTCQGKVYQCGDCLDNDSDGLIDARDPNCLGPCDNNESGFNMQIPGGNNQACKLDCYYDQDGGSGNDKCEWDHRCDTLQPLEVADCKYNTDTENSLGCSSCTCEQWQIEQPQACLDFCGPLTPNGCDCFGCCQLGPLREWRFLGSPNCSVDNIENCSPCTPVGSCLNTCGRCELCLGKTEIPADCKDVWDTDSDTATWDTDTENMRCTPGVQPCGLSGDPQCPMGTYCITGCCQVVSLG